MKYYVFYFFILFNAKAVVTAQRTATISSAEITFAFVAEGVEGRISGFDSASTINPNAFEASDLRGSVAVETIKTGNFLRDWSLKSGKYFDAKTYPQITFISTDIQKVDQGYEVIGKLTLKGRSKSITINFKKENHQFIGTTALFSSDFGIDIKNEREDNMVKIKIVCSIESSY